MIAISIRTEAQQSGSRRPDVVAVYYPHWHQYEWTEGCYLLPEARTGTAYLEAIKKTFGIKSSSGQGK